MTEGRTGQRRRIVILGAAGRDFHVFNTAFRDDAAHQVVAFTAAQIPNIAGRAYPASLAGALYPAGIPIREEADLPRLLREEAIDEVVFAYSDVTHAHVMHLASIALAGGADFALLGPKRTMLAAAKPVIAVCAVRTGCGKSQVTRWIAARLRARGLRVGVLRHPMPYGDLARQAVQRFASREDLDAADCTIEEREEYEPHIAAGQVVYAGVDYAAILASAQAESDILLWEGGNNDFPFLRPDLLITLVDPLRPGHESAYHPGEGVLRMADVVLVAKSNAALEDDIASVIAATRRMNPDAVLVRGASRVTLDDPGAVRGKRVLVVEDGPTLTHGGMATGAGHAAALAAGVAEIVDPRRSASPAIAAVFAAFPHLGRVLPAMGYDAAQRAALAETIARSEAELVVSGTPAALEGLTKPVIRARYAYEEAEEPGLGAVVDGFVAAAPG
ncbi:GTPase [Roseomonas eburnea]|uniref:GTPase n=1 Tax=Neoroseomonas eburnea TaxID=1346889 RepID=A0A9X9X738_9PROT|nr:cyclic 2,3-diphosphoglycerate synthase [Neoroseomonas eburnea]MBR0679524.1 GTPase [Neoroseomonas eburnea]